MEYALRILYGLAQEGRTNKRCIPKSLYITALIAELSDSRMAGAQSLLNPFIPVLAARARKKGIEKKLLQRYCL